MCVQRQFYSVNGRCGPRQVCCRRPPAPPVHTGLSSNLIASNGQCGKRNTHGITGRIKTPAYVDGDSEFGKRSYCVLRQRLREREREPCRNENTLLSSNAPLFNINGLLVYTVAALMIQNNNKIIHALPDRARC